MNAMDNPQYLRNRAEEMRTVAEQLRDPSARSRLLGLASDYDRMAERMIAVQRARRKMGVGHVI